MCIHKHINNRNVIKTTIMQYLYGGAIMHIALKLTKSLTGKNKLDYEILISVNIIITHLINSDTLKFELKTIS